MPQPHPDRPSTAGYGRTRRSASNCELALQIVLEPFELLVAEIAEAAGLEIDDVDEADEVHAAGVEAEYQPSPLVPLAVAFPVELAPPRR